MARRRRDLEHDHTSRLAEAEATVRRLQVTALLLYQHWATAMLWVLLTAKQHMVKQPHANTIMQASEGQSVMYVARDAG